MKTKILKKVSEVFNVSPEEIILKSGKRNCVDARFAYFLSMDVLGLDIHEVNKEMPFSYTMPSFYVSRALELFTLYREYRVKVIACIKCFDEYASQEFSRKNPLLASENKQDLSFLYKPEKKYLKMYFKPEKKAVITNYTYKDILRINRACAEAEKFFETYGKGAGMSPIVDRRKYYN